VSPGRRLVGVAALVVAALAGTAQPAAAHPLGNFTVNHYDGLSLRPDGVEDLAVVDSAEIPTLQARPAVEHVWHSFDETLHHAEHVPPA